MINPAALAIDTACAGLISATPRGALYDYPLPRPELITSDWRDRTPGQNTRIGRRAHGAPARTEHWPCLRRYLTQSVLLGSQSILWYPHCNLLIQ